MHSIGRQCSNELRTPVKSPAQKKPRRRHSSKSVPSPAEKGSEPSPSETTSAESCSSRPSKGMRQAVYRNEISRSPASPIPGIPECRIKSWPFDHMHIHIYIYGPPDAGNQASWMRFQKTTRLGWAMGRLKVQPVSSRRASGEMKSGRARLGRARIGQAPVGKAQLGRERIGMAMSGNGMRTAGVGEDPQNGIGMTMNGGSRVFSTSMPVRILGMTWMCPATCASDSPRSSFVRPLPKKAKLPRPTSCWRPLYLQCNRSPCLT